MDKEQIENLIQVLEDELNRLDEEEDGYGFLDLGDELCVEHVRVREGEDKFFIGKEVGGSWLDREQAIKAVDFIQGKLQPEIDI